ncbi:hypothetical protein BV25DRAFT_1918402 [Artomyces pyxidatus]|uniref:Uncharacterized protein n=1 Tax=Artomyces pyxidatus TaxID=48021 RepID=A0ACB8STY7_9AGAM|nr:hypothetical protein BV25DRAFT_1918402 [Artomyces pyxidatus]
MPPDVLVFWYRGEMVYFYEPDGKSYEEVLDYAKSVYPELKSISRHRIAFHVSGPPQSTTDTTYNSPRISPAAWDIVLQELNNYSDLSIYVLGSAYAEAYDTAPPRYSESYRRDLYSTSLQGEEKKEGAVLGGKGSPGRPLRRRFFGWT